MLRIGPNPYGLTCTLGLHPDSACSKDLEWFVGLAENMRAGCIEFEYNQVASLPVEGQKALRRRLEALRIEPVLGAPWTLARVPEAFPVARHLGARIIRTHLSPVLCGARAELGDRWPEMVTAIRRDLANLGPKLCDEGLTLAVENHQDFGSDELVEFCHLGGPAVGITLDTGNPLAVGETPTSFASNVAGWVRHIHLKDYRVQATPEGFRLVRCAIGDGVVPFTEIERLLRPHHVSLTASLEPGALAARHVKLLTPEWWHGYRPKSDAEKETCLAATKRNAIPPDQDWRTPMERGDDIQTVCNFEQEQMNKSIANMQALGWLPA